MFYAQSTSTVISGREHTHTHAQQREKLRRGREAEMAGVAWPPFSTSSHRGTRPRGDCTVPGECPLPEKVAGWGGALGDSFPMYVWQTSSAGEPRAPGGSGLSLHVLSDTSSELSGPVVATRPARAAVGREWLFLFCSAPCRTPRLILGGRFLVDCQEADGLY